VRALRLLLPPPILLLPLTPASPPFPPHLCSYEVELIERARARRQFDASLPDIRQVPPAQVLNPTSSLRNKYPFDRQDPDKWRDMMEEQQMREMKDREQQARPNSIPLFGLKFSRLLLPQIIRLQAARLDLMRDALRKQEDETEFDNMRRVAKVGPHAPPTRNYFLVWIPGMT
jgi:hypothetical protein